MNIRKPIKEMELLLENSPLAFVLTNANNDFLFVNQRFSEMFGYSEEEILQIKIQELTHPESVAQSIEIIKKVYAGHGPQTIRKRYVKKDGAILEAVTRVAAVFDDNGKPLYQCTSIEDITEQVNIEKQLLGDRLRTETIVETATDAIIEIDSENCIKTCNPAAQSIFDKSTDEMIGRNIAEFIRDETSDAAALTTSLAHSKPKPIVLPDGMFGVKDSDLDFPIEVSISSYEADNNVYRCLFIRDITERKEQEKRQKYFAKHDYLTGLPNRASFSEFFQNQAINSKHSSNQHALFFIDLDNFKKVNDSFGHQTGDLLLKQVSARLAQSIRGSDFVARMGGDEFIILVSDLTNRAEIDAIARKIIEKFSVPFEVEQLELCVTPSIGVSIYPSDAETPESLLKNADIAMYRAKAEGGNNHQYFEPIMEANATNRMAVEFKLRDAVKEHAIDIWYQPQFNLNDRLSDGLEVLARWQDRHGDFIAASQFIPVAEETGLIRSLGAQIMEKACANTKPLFDDGTLTGRIAINVSPVQFHHRNFFDEVKSILQNTRFDPKNLELEITESTIIYDMEATKNLILELQYHGISVALDDFGTGYSSMSYLRSLPLDVLKIDKSYIDDIPSSKRDLRMTEFIVQLAHELRLCVVAEGVEREDQATALSAISCNKAQGFYFAKPAPLRDITELQSAVRADMENNKLATVHRIGRPFLSGSN